MDVIQDNVMNYDYKFYCLYYYGCRCVQRAYNLEKSGYTLQMLIFDYIILNDIVLIRTIYFFIFFFLELL